MAQIIISDLPPSPDGTGSGVPKGTDLTPATDTTDTTEAASGTTKKYTRAAEFNYELNAMGLIALTACRLATVSALTATYANGASGVGATLTNSGAMAALVIDGVAVVAADRVLVKDQAAPAQNGIYTVTNIGSGATNWVLTRATDYDQSSDIAQNDVVLINQGTTNKGLLFQQTTAGPFTIGTTAIVFEPFSFTPQGTVYSLQGTANQVLVNGTSGTPVSGADIILTAPQDIATTSSVQFFNIRSNNVWGDLTNIVSAGGTTVLTLNSTKNQSVTGVLAQTMQLPNATTLSLGWEVAIYNLTTQSMPINDNGSNLITTLDPNTVGIIKVKNISSANGVWVYYESSLTLPLPVAVGGTALSSTPTNGQLLIGNSTGYTLSTLTAGSGIGISNGAGSITLSTTGTVWTEVASTPQSGVVNTSYYITNAAATTVNVPATFAKGSYLQVQGYGAGGWILQMNTGQTCNFLGAATTSGGTITSTSRYDGVTILCTVANTTFVVTNNVGVLTLA